MPRPEVRVAPTKVGTMSDFDLVVLGAGPGGYVAAIRASQLGLKAGDAAFFLDNSDTEIRVPSCDSVDIVVFGAGIQYCQRALPPERVKSASAGIKQPAHLTAR